jgi:hypothetical protein
LLASETFAGVQPMNTTWFERGIEKGVEKERREWLRELLEGRFGALAPSVLAKLDQLSADELQTLRKALKEARSLADLGLVD